MTDINTPQKKVKRTMKEKFMFVVTGKYPDKKVKNISNKSKNKSKKVKPSFFDGIKELIVGKKKDKKDKGDNEDESQKSKKEEYQEKNIFTEEDDSEKKKTVDISNEEKFEKATKMTLQQAEKKVFNWYKNKEMEKVKQGTLLILQYFPNHYLKNEPPKEIKSNIINENEAVEKIVKINENKKKNSVEKNVDEINSDKKIKDEEIKHEDDEEVEKHEEANEIENNDKGENEDEDFVDESLLRQMASRPWESVGIKLEDLEKEGLPQESEINDDERVFAGISYFPFLSFFVITTRKDSPFALYHAWQGFAILAIFLASLPFYFLLKFIFGMSFIFWLFYMVLFGVSAFAAFMAWSGRYVQIPVISGFAKKLSGK